MKHVFLSHSYQDEAIARQIQKICRKKEIDIYMCQDDLKPDELVSSKLKEMIQTASYVIVLITENSLESYSVNQEIGVAIGANRPIIQLVKRGINPSLLFLIGKEYITFDPVKVSTGIHKVINYIEKKEAAATRERCAIWGIIIFLICLIFKKDKNTKENGIEK